MINAFSAFTAIFGVGVLVFIAVTLYCDVHTTFWKGIKTIIGISEPERIWMPVRPDPMFLISPLARATIEALKNHSDWSIMPGSGLRSIWLHRSGELKLLHRGEELWIHAPENIRIMAPAEFGFDEKDHPHVLAAFKCMNARRIEATRAKA